MSPTRQTRRSFLKRAGLIGAGMAAAGSGIYLPHRATAADDSNTVNFYARGDEAIFGVFKELKAAFEKANPGMTVKIEEAPSSDWDQKFQLKLASGQAPDCLFECDCTITSQIRNGALEPLDDLIKNDTRFNKTDYWDISWYTSEFDGKTYGLPYDGGSVVLFYNLDLFQKAGVEPLDPKTPLTWDKWVEIARKLTVDRNGKRADEDGFDAKRISQFGISPNTSLPWPYVFGSGGEVITPDGQVPLDSPEATEGLQFIADLRLKHHVAPDPLAENTNFTFLTNNVAMDYDGVWNMVRFREAKFKWDVAPFPTNKVQTSTGWYSPLSITAQAKNKEGAWKWISFCCSEQGEQIVSKLGQAVPPLKKLAQSATFLDPTTEPKNKQVFLNQMDATILRTPGDKMGKYFGGYRKEWSDVFSPIFDKVLRGDQSAADGMKEARPKLENLLKTGKVSFLGNDCGCGRSS